VTSSPTRIVVHDYSGHPGQAQLSRALARRGYRVTHQHCPSYVTGKGSLERAPGDPPGLRFESVSMGREFKRYSFLRRVAQETGYGLRAGRAIAAHDPDVAIVSNVPLLAHALLALRLSRTRTKTIFWHQDIYSAAIGATAIRLSPRIGPLAARAAERIERSIARSSDAIVAISPTFLDKLGAWGVDAKTTVVPNWAPIEEIPRHAKRNRWSERMRLADAPVVLYSGTLGLKHDPSILAAIAADLAGERPEARMVVVSEGRGRQWLEDYKRDHDAPNLVLLDYQPYEDLPEVLASADLLVAVLEPDASKYSVPSKVLTYLCAGRPVVGIMPSDNSVAEILVNNAAGVVVEPTEREKVSAAVLEILEHEDRREELGRAGRRYAEAEFSPDRAADRFESVFGPWLAASEPAGMTGSRS